jgi:hypothetical protein
MAHIYTLDFGNILAHWIEINCSTEGFIESVYARHTNKSLLKNILKNVSLFYFLKKK